LVHIGCMSGVAGADSSRLQLCIEWGGARSHPGSLFLCLSKYDESLGALVTVAVTDSFLPGAAASFSPAFTVEWAFEEELLYHVQLCENPGGNKRVLSDCQFIMSEAVASRRLNRPLMRQLVPVNSSAPAATLMITLQNDYSCRTRVFRIHASCHDLRGTGAILEIQFLSDRFVGEGQSRMDSECQWKMRTRVTEVQPFNDQAEDQVPLLISISRPGSVRSFDVVPKLKMQSSVRALSEAAVSNRPILLAAVQGSLELRIHVCAFEYEMSLFDRIAAGLEINMSFAIDFSISNGDQRNPSSLHYMGEDVNVYQRLIATFTQHMQHYSNAQRIVMLGFGAQLQDGTVSNCFSLNGRSHQPRCDGATAALQAYETALANVDFSGPTCIAPSINAVVGMNCEILGPDSLTLEYHIMAVVFDTPCRDLQASLSVHPFKRALPNLFLLTLVAQDTIDAVVNSSFWPISIVLASCFSIPPSF
jgi:hypothetical protein